jgi:hypothetical protein
MEKQRESEMRAAAVTLSLAALLALLPTLADAKGSSMGPGRRRISAS